MAQEWASIAQDMSLFLVESKTRPGVVGAEPCHRNGPSPHKTCPCFLYNQRLVGAGKVILHGHQSLPCSDQRAVSLERDAINLARVALLVQ
jgi:hypothetical protein